MECETKKKNKIEAKTKQKADGKVENGVLSDFMAADVRRLNKLLMEFHLSVTLRKILRASDIK